MNDSKDLIDDINDSIEQCEDIIHSMKDLVEARRVLANEIAADNTERVMEDTQNKKLYDALDVVKNDNISTKEVKQLAQDTLDFLKRIDAEDSYDDAMKRVIK